MLVSLRDKKFRQWKRRVLSNGSTESRPTLLRWGLVWDGSMPSLPRIVFAGARKTVLSASRNTSYRSGLFCNFLWVKWLGLVNKF